jgi:elongation factor P
MAVIQATEIRKGTAIMYEGAPYRVLTFAHRTPGNLRAFVQVKLRNLRDGTQREVRLSSTETIERAAIMTREMDCLYPESGGWVLMDAETYDQITLDEEALGDALPWITEGMRLLVEMLDDNPIGVELPKTVEIEVRETEPVMKGQTAAKSNKPATLANGVVVQVPPFVAAGDRIKVDPGERRYIERAK